jgi:HEPN domain-containing protein
MDQAEELPGAAYRRANIPREVYYPGSGFYLAGRRCLVEMPLVDGRVQWLGSYGAVNLCLASELFMKSLIIRAGDEPEWTHRLAQLWSALPPDDQTAIAHAYTRFAPRDLDDDILETSNYFVELRYSHQYPRDGYDVKPAAAVADTLYMYCGAIYNQRPQIDEYRI